MLSSYCMLILRMLMSLQYRSAPRRQLALGMTGGTASTAVGVGFFSSNSNPPGRWHSWHSSRRGIFQQHLSLPWQVAQLASCTRDARVSGCLMAPPVKAFTCIVHHKTFTLKYNFMWAAVVAASRFLSQQLLPDHRQEPGRG